MGQLVPKSNGSKLNWSLQNPTKYNCVRHWHGDECRLARVSGYVNAGEMLCVLGGTGSGIEEMFSISWVTQWDFPQHKHIIQAYLTLLDLDCITSTCQYSVSLGLL